MKTQYITFSVQIKKELDDGKTITYKIKFFDNFGFMSNSLSNLADHLAEGFHSYKCTDCKSCLEYISNFVKLLIFKRLKCNKHHHKGFNKDLVKRFANTYEFCNGDISKFILLLRKGIHPYEYMDS